MSITDDDDPAVTVRFGEASYEVAEGAMRVVTVELSDDPERTVVIPIERTNQDGATADDYSGVPQTVTFTSGETSRTFTFTAEDDSEDDDGESVLLSFGSSLPPGVSEGTPAETTVSITDDDDPAVTVRFGEASYTVAEGAMRVVTVELSDDPERTVVIPIERTNQGATADDYSGVPQTVTFTSGETSRTFIFSATDDSEDDDGESVLLGFGASLPAGVSAGSPAETTVSITDDDDPAVTVRFGEASYEVAEGAMRVVTVELSDDPERTVVIPIERTNQDGATADDYSGVPQTVTFTSGETSRTFTFTAEDDSEDDDGESVLLSFGSSLPPGVSEGTPAETTVSITDDDDPAVTVRFGEASYTVAEGAMRVVTVELSDDPERTVVIPIERTNQGATADDYSGVPASVTFTSGQTSTTFTFTAEADDEDDDGESVLLSFGSSLPPGVSAGTPAETTVSITDDDDPAVTVSFGEASYTVAEGATRVVTVELSADPERTVVIPIERTNQGATADDYSGVPASVTFTSGQTSTTFTFTAEADDEDDDGESVLLSFGSSLPPGVSAGTPAETTVSITDDDDPAVTVSFGEASYTVAEGATRVVTVELSADPERTVVIPIGRTNQGEATDTDYSGVPQTVTFTSAETSRTFTFTAEDDSEDDDGESVLLGFGATLPAGVSAGTPATSTVTITDDDDPAVTVSFGAAAYTVAEGATRVVTVSLSANPERTVVIPITTTGQGTATTADYSGVPTSVTFSASQDSRTFTFSATDDDVDDDGESVLLGFGATLPAGVSAGTPATSTVTITDDDDPDVTVSFGQSAYTVAEGLILFLTVSLSANPERTVVIPITTTGQGTATTADYSGVPDNITFSASQSSRTFTFSATADDVDDDGESVLLGFGATLPAGVSAGTPATSTVTITDDDDPDVTVSFGQSAYTVAEGATRVVTVSLSADPERTVVIPITKTEQGDATTGDYSGVPTSVTFSASQDSRTFIFSATDDSEDDDGESVLLGFGASLPAGVSAGSPAETTVSITDDDDPAVTVSFGAASYTVDEGGMQTVTVELSDDPERTVVIPIGRTNQGEATDTDYSGVPQTVTFTRGETSRTFTFSAEDDSEDDDGENVLLRFGSSLPAGVSAGTPAETTVSITDDDDPAVTVNFGEASYEVAEGATRVVTVELSADPERTVVIPIERTNQDGATADDYSGVPQTVTFTSGETSRTFTFTAEADTEDDDGESVRLSLRTMTDARVSQGSPSEAMVNIRQDLMGSTTDCNSSIWCADIEFHTPNLSENLWPLGSKGLGGGTEFDYNGVTYAYGGVRVAPYGGNIPMEALNWPQNTADQAVPGRSVA